MKVYIVEKHIPYEGFDIVGVYQTEKLAAVVVAALSKAETYYRFQITEHEVAE